MIAFEKYHGTGNDFILMDDRLTKMNLSTGIIKKMCDRHFGIGADGLIQLRNKEGFDFEMIYYNSDGLTGSMCGNGGRCIVAFAAALNIIKNTAHFIAFDGEHKAVVSFKDSPVVKLQMKNVSDIEVNENVVLNTGSPHIVIFVSDTNAVDVVNEGKRIRYNDRFKKEGINVNFVSVNNNELSVRTYERGVEDETLSCGTGVVASVLAASAKGMISNSECTVSTPGGKLKVHFKKTDLNFTDIWLEGPAVKVFSGGFSL